MPLCIADSEEDSEEVDEEDSEAAEAVPLRGRHRKLCVGRDWYDANGKRREYAKLGLWDFGRQIH
jgi:hypothetical protein